MRWRYQHTAKRPQATGCSQSLRCPTMRGTLYSMMLFPGQGHKAHNTWLLTSSLMTTANLGHFFDICTLWKCMTGQDRPCARHQMCDISNIIQPTSYDITNMTQPAGLHALAVGFCVQCATATGPGACCSACRYCLVRV